jgi:hypothetical protein
MPRLRAVVGLDGADRRLLAEALGAVAAVRVALILLPFRRVRSMVRRCSVPRRSLTQASSESIASWVSRSSSVVPGANCLVQALAALILLARHGRVGTLRIGARRVGPAVQAHAWVECEGQVVVGGRDDLSTFHVLLRASDVAG